MRLSVLLLSALLASGVALPGTAMAHGYGGHGHGHGHLSYGRDGYRHRRHHRRKARRHWRRHDHPVYRPYYRHRYRDHDDRWGIHLFFSGH